MKPTAILLLHCPDQQGIISEVTKFITDNQGNIVDLDQYVDHQDGMFFMRIQWELDGFLIPREKINEYIKTLYAQRYQMEFNLYFSDQRPRMAIFVSKMSHCLYDLLARWKAGEYDVDIPCIVSNHEDLRYVAEQFGIPYHVWSIKKDHSNKAEVEQAEMDLLKKEKVTFIVLARYMQIISDDMIAAYPHHIINIHHSFLPAFVGAKPYHQAWERGVKIIGATSHYVTAELDAGPIIEQDVARITHKDTPESLVLKGKDLEKIVLSRAVSKHIQRKILTYKNKTIIFS
ncbi:MAG: formyltetrahydrofolate deformylase [Prevotella sp.]|uniref:formyltetrahydrofolate deformylase n=1 Tax=Prevotella sp. E13-27 TaxID=2938122 RepID=UPI00200B16AD|nr:formyltetrahydrofolate deformylase [Prevotella sp. E13-27]MBQ7663243.1 formyltetrahydrofolate deformylase [Prevotella sp.]MBR4566422.1 formyltetrahydrofolate deformylase [Prevotella sp.]MCK8623066.1 formyltetrahydrofolate deformylase [Prevotella sp. E13-27]MCR5817984.1 formyltetrahydrofolate deformylase [Prevotella sp.]